MAGVITGSGFVVEGAGSQQKSRRRRRLFLVPIRQFLAQGCAA
jgi:hypothetical protein